MRTRSEVKRRERQTNEEERHKPSGETRLEPQHCNDPEKTGTGCCCELKESEPSSLLARAALPAPSATAAPISRSHVPVGGGACPRSNMSSATSPMPLSNGGVSADPDANAKRGLHLLLTNRFGEAGALYTAEYDRDLRMALLHTHLSFLSAISSHSETDLQSALDDAWRAEKSASKQSYAQSGRYGDQSLFLAATLVQADTHLLGAWIQVLQESVVKAALNLRRAYNFYKSAHGTLTTTYSGSDKEQLLGWAHFGLGLFNIFISLLPPTVVAIASWVGFHGDRATGLRMLEQSTASPSFVAPYSSLLLLSYYVSISAFTGAESPEYLSAASKLLDDADANYPNGAFFALMRSRWHRCRGELRQAIELSDGAIGAVSELPSLSIVFHYQSGWCAYFLLSYDEAARYLDRLLHSKLHGNFKPADGGDGLTDEERTAVAALAKQSSVAAVADPGPNGDYRMPTMKASVQSFYAYHIGICYAMVERWELARWYLAMAGSFIRDSGSKPRPIDMYARDRAADHLAKPRDAVYDYALDAAELLYGWNGLRQMPAEAIRRAYAQMQAAIAAEAAAEAATKRGDATATAPWTEEDRARAQLFCAAYERALGAPQKGAEMLEQLLQTSGKKLANSKRAQQLGVLAIANFALAECYIDLSRFDDAAAARKKSAETKGFHLYNTFQFKLHAMKALIAAKRREIGGDAAAALSPDADDDDAAGSGAQLSPDDA